jgi:hypothetical protein
MKLPTHNTPLNDIITELEKINIKNIYLPVISVINFAILAICAICSLVYLCVFSFVGQTMRVNFSFYAKPVLGAKDKKIQPSF